MSRPFELCLFVLASAGLSACAGADEDGAGAAPVESGCSATDFDWGAGGELMLPGTDCGSCHRADGKAKAVLTIAGTVFQAPDCPAGAAEVTVLVQAADGLIRELASNSVGNFFTAEPLVPPYRYSLELDGVVSGMITTTSNGSCGTCHAEGSSLGWLAVPPG